MPGGSSPRGSGSTRAGGADRSTLAAASRGYVTGVVDHVTETSLRRRVAGRGTRDDVRSARVGVAVRRCDDRCRRVRRTRREGCSALPAGRGIPRDHDARRQPRMWYAYAPEPSHLCASSGEKRKRFGAGSAMVISCSSQKVLDEDRSPGSGVPTRGAIDRRSAHDHVDVLALDATGASSSMITRVLAGLLAAAGRSRPACRRRRCRSLRRSGSCPGGVAPTRRNGSPRPASWRVPDAAEQAAGSRARTPIRTGSARPSRHSRRRSASRRDGDREPTHALLRIATVTQTPPSHRPRPRPGAPSIADRAPTRPVRVDPRHGAVERVRHPHRCPRRRRRRWAPRRR